MRVMCCDVADYLIYDLVVKGPMELGRMKRRKLNCEGQARTSVPDRWHTIVTSQALTILCLELPPSSRLTAPRMLFSRTESSQR